MKRYSLGKVYRRDQPALSRGRLRKFWQAEFDITCSGGDDSSNMVADAEVLRVVGEVFDTLDLGPGLRAVIRINHRNVLEGIFAVAGVEDKKIKGVSSAVDKLDKISWKEVWREIVEEKGIPEDVADRVGSYVAMSGELRDMIERLRREDDGALAKNEKVKAGLKDMALLAECLEALGVIDKVSFDLSLARGLDYYTGVTFEVVVARPGGREGRQENNSSPVSSLASQVGSIAAGGRYDNLVGMFGKRQMPCVGVSFGVERIFTILNARQEKTFRREMDVYIMAGSRGSTGANGGDDDDTGGGSED